MHIDIRIIFFGTIGLVSLALFGVEGFKYAAAFLIGLMLLSLFPIIVPPEPTISERQDQIDKPLIQEMIRVHEKKIWNAVFIVIFALAGYFLGE